MRSGIKGACLVLALSACTVAEDELQLRSGLEGLQFDESVRPQDDFYKHVNGTWLAQSVIPDDKSRWGVFPELMADTEKFQYTILRELAEAQATSLSADARKLSDLYRSVVERDASGEAALERVNDILRQIAEVQSRDEFLLLTSDLRSFGVSSPITVDVDFNLVKASEYAVYVYQGGLTLPVKDAYLADVDFFKAVLARYTNYLEAILRAAGLAGRGVSAADVLAFETELAKIQWSETEMRDVSRMYNPFAVSDLDSQVSDIVDWQDFLGRSRLGHAEQVIVVQPQYLRDLKDVIDATPLETLKAYYAVQVMNLVAPYLGGEYAEIHSDFFDKVLKGRDKPQPQWEQAVELANEYLSDAMGQEYVRRGFSAKAKAATEDIAQNILKAFDAGIDGIAWMEAQTKQEAHRKLGNIVYKVGYTKNWDSYAGLDIKPDDLLGNVLRGNTFNYGQNIKLLGKPVDRSKWRSPPQEFNASYNRSLNEMTFPAAFLQRPFFDASAEPAFNYGAIGSIIGHEVGHAFDDQGRKFDADGNLNDWWSARDAEVFSELAQKLVDQFGAYEPLEGHKIDGDLTLGENIGDLTGLEIAWQAYLLSLDGKEPPVIDGYTAQERFLVGYAQLWRWKYRDEALISMLRENPHSPPMFRANGPLENLSLFQETYSVREGDRMYKAPEKRVKIW